MAALALVAGSVLASGVAASAAAAPTVTATNVTYTEAGCFTSQVAVSGMDPATSYHVEVDAPGGSVLVEDTYTGESQHTLPATLCFGSDPVGTYTVKLDGATATTFAVSQPVVQTSRISKRAMGGRLTQNGKPLSGKAVHVHVYLQGDWYDVLTLHTDRQGRFGLYCKKHHRCADQFRFVYRDFVASSTFRLYTGPKNGRIGAVGDARSVAAGLARR